jgi:hypothetical protein
MHRVPVLLLTVALVLAGCTAQQRRAISETVVRNVVALEGAKEFKNHGYPIRDHLVCKAKANSSDESQVGVVCTGTATTGQAVGLIGTTNNIRGNQGRFVGTVDGRQVFSETCLGC